MKALVIYDDRCRNTRQIAEVVSTALQATMHVHIVTRDTVTLADLKSVDVVVIGCRIRPHDATSAGDTFLEDIPLNVLRAKAFALYDTCLEGWQLLTRSAAETLARKLLRKGAAIILPPESFYVSSFTEPLSQHELHRASNWARAIQQQLQLLPF